MAFLCDGRGAALSSLGMAVALRLFVVGLAASARSEPWACGLAGLQGSRSGAARAGPLERAAWAARLAGPVTPSMPRALPLGELLGTKRQSWRAARRRGCVLRLHAGSDAGNMVASMLDMAAASLESVGKASFLVFFQHRGRCLTWIKIAALLIVQQNCVPKAWESIRGARRRLFAQKVKLESAEEIRRVQDALQEGSLIHDVEIRGHVLPAGTQVFISARKLAKSKFPLTLRCQQYGNKKMTQDVSLAQNVVAVIRRAEVPFLLWGWSRILLDGISYSLQWWPGLSKRNLNVMHAMIQQFGTLMLLTAMTWFVHRLLAWWRDKRSRGRATVDVLGWESSLREAQVNALTVSLQVVVWSLYTCGVLWICGIEVGRVLLFPSVTAVLIGWIGREVVANIISGVVIHITQPFAQGDWVTMENGSIDGWVQDTGTFYTRVIQWDKRPIYVPNFKLMSMNVQNNSRMTHRRVLFELPLRIKDIPKVPQIVQDMQEMINQHEDIDAVQHRLVRWRCISGYSANIWVSCYTHPTVQGIRLGHFTAVEQSVLERCSQIVYKHDAEFASQNDRYPHISEADQPPSLEKMITKNFFESFNSSREAQLESREQVLRQREKELKERERNIEGESDKIFQRSKVLTKAEEKYRDLIAKALVNQEVGRSSQDGAGELVPRTPDSNSTSATQEASTADTIVSAKAAEVRGHGSESGVIAAPVGEAEAGRAQETKSAEPVPLAAESGHAKDAEVAQATADKVLAAASDGARRDSEKQDTAQLPTEHTSEDLEDLEAFLSSSERDEEPSRKKPSKKAENIRIPVKEMGD